MPVESLLPLLLSVVYAGAALLVWPRPSLAWRGAGTAAALACVITVVAIVASAKGWIRTPALVLAMLSLVSVLGAVIVRYSRRYLDGEAGQPRYVAALLITLGAVSTLVVTDHLGLMLGAWIISSFALHHLLTFYRDRPAAQSAAHKKFIASRLAELSMFGALLLIHQDAGTLSIEQLGAQWRELPALTGSLQVAAVLLVFGAMLKSAQLPLHGWLIQVMEAPTPVSALLHAGVVNIGGYVLIRLASLLELAPAAQALLVIGGSLTAVLASLVMITRISIKVRLAWSTCAQMGFMLMECGLGLYELAFLHLLAHSVYKAHAFLSAGSTVDQRRRADLAPVIHLPPPRRLIVAGAVAMPLTMLIAQGSALLWQVPLPGVELPAVALVVAALGLAPLLWQVRYRGRWRLGLGLVRVLLLTQTLLALHALACLLVPPAASSPPLLLSLWVAALFTALYAAQLWLTAYPRGRLALALHPRAYAGFHLDQRFTRLSFRIWPPARAAAHDFGDH
jgi:NAD(P)H-quinone oxidoreductase subunit 5